MTRPARALTPAVLIAAACVFALRGPATRDPHAAEEQGPDRAQPAAAPATAACVEPYVEPYVEPRVEPRVESHADPCPPCGRARVAGAGRVFVEHYTQDESER